MNSFLIILGLLIIKMSTNSNFNSDYPNITICVIPNLHPIFPKSRPYIYLKNQLGLGKKCTHIRGSLSIQNLHSFDNGSDPDLSFLDSIVEISGTLKISFNSVKRIPLGNLKVIRGLYSSDEDFSLAISHNLGNESHHLEDLDLHSLTAIMNKHIRINNNFALQYLTNNVDWTQIVLNPNSQNITIQPSSHNKMSIFQCNPLCKYWNSTSGGRGQFCFGPLERDCQQRSKCSSYGDATWCNYNKDIEVPCDDQCAGGCVGRLSRHCMVCNGVYKKDKCVSHCAAEQSKIFGHYDEQVKEDKLIYTTGALCTSHCPDSLLDQDKFCLFNCDFSKYYKKGDRCLECPNQNCNNRIGDQLMCDLRKLDPNYPKDERKYSLNKETLIKLTNCTVILGQFSIDDNSFNSKSVTLPLLYEHLKNVQEIIGEILIIFLTTDVKNLTFLQNLKEIRGIVHNSASLSGLKVFVKNLEFLGLKKLRKVYGAIHFDHKSQLCYENTIPWQEITKETIMTGSCNNSYTEICHRLCTRGCWGPGNKLCYKCNFMEAGEYCVEKCEDAPEYYTWVDQSNFSKNECRKCHPLCKESCTGPSSRECTKCLKAKEGDYCVEKCSENYYPLVSFDKESTTCELCHTSCYVRTILGNRNLSSTCSGPLNIFGPGGCSLCDKVIIQDNMTTCHKGQCPTGFFQDFYPLSIEQKACKVCHPNCEECTGSGSERRSCVKCKMFWYNGNCTSTCPMDVLNVSRNVEAGDECPSCHVECQGICHTENNDTACLRCIHKKVYHNYIKNIFSCVLHCPAERNYTDIIEEDLVCLSYQETSYYKQRLNILFIILGCMAGLTLAVIIIALFFRYKFRQSKIKADLKAFYSNFNESNMKNLSTDQLSRPPNMNRLQIIPISDLIFDSKSQPLGAGAFGKVYRGYWKALGPDGNMYSLAVVLKVMHNYSKASTDEFLDEAQIMASVCHRHCLPLIGVCLSLEKPCLVSSFAKYGSLDKYLVQYSNTIPSLSLIKWSEQIADGMTYLNLRGIIHRDLAARNILLSQETIVQITDFGLARLVDDTDDGIVVQSGRVPIRWLALETLLYSNYSTASDIWAYGVTLWEIFTYGKRPYEKLDTSKIKVFLQEGNRLPQPDICTLEVYMVMIKCWLEEPQMRPSFQELMTTFELFSRNSKRYLCLPSEHREEYFLNRNRDDVCLKNMSLNPDLKSFTLLSAGSEDIFSNNTLQDNSTYHLINSSYNKEEQDDHSSLPRKKKPKRNTSFNKLKSLSKVNLSKLLTNKGTEMKIVQYCPADVNNGVKYSSLRYDSTTALISSPRSPEYSRHPLHPQISKLIKKQTWHPPQESEHNIEKDKLSSPESIFNKEYLKPKDINTSFKTNEQNSNMSSFNIHKFPSKENSLKNEKIKPVAISPDSGNNQDFELDDYMLPSRVLSPGYYNLTPPPSANTKPTMDLNDSSILLSNDNYSPLTDDGYMEPSSKLTS